MGEFTRGYQRLTINHQLCVSKAEAKAEFREPERLSAAKPWVPVSWPVSLVKYSSWILPKQICVCVYIYDIRIYTYTHIYMYIYMYVNYIYIHIITKILIFGTVSVSKFLSVAKKKNVWKCPPATQFSHDLPVDENPRNPTVDGCEILQQ